MTMYFEHRTLLSKDNQSILERLELIIENTPNLSGDLKWTVDTLASKILATVSVTQKLVAALSEKPEWAHLAELPLKYHKRILEMVETMHQTGRDGYIATKQLENLAARDRDTAIASFEAAKDIVRYLKEHR